MYFAASRLRGSGFLPRFLASRRRRFSLRQSYKVGSRIRIWNHSRVTRLRKRHFARRTHWSALLQHPSKEIVMSKSIPLSATVAAGAMRSHHIRQTLADQPPALGRQCPRSRRTARVVRALAAMSKLGIVGVTALSFASAVATPAFAVGLRGGGSAMHVGSGGFRGAQASVVSRADASYCAQRWAYYDPAAGKYMGDDGEWHPCR